MYKLDKLKSHREAQGWSQSLLSELSGVSRRTIQRVESGSHASKETAMSLAATFNLDKISSLQSQAKPVTKEGNRREPEESFSSHCNTRLLMLPVAIAAICFVGVYILLEHFGAIAMYDGVDTAFENGLLATCMTIVAALIFWIETYEHQDEPNHATRAFRWFEKPSCKRYQKGIKRYLNKYPVNDDQCIIGEHPGSSTLIRHTNWKMGTGSVLIGEDGSGLQLVTACQMFDPLRRGRGGVYFLNEHEQILARTFASFFAVMGRTGDLYQIPLSEAESHNWDWWQDAFSNQKFYIVIVPLADRRRVQKVVEVINSPTVETDFTNVSCPLICLDNTHVRDPLALKQQLQITRRTQMTLPFLTVSQPELAVDNEWMSLLSYFDHKFIMKMHNPRNIKRLVDELHFNDTESSNVNTYISYGPGEATYSYSGKVWPHVHLAFYDYWDG